MTNLSIKKNVILRISKFLFDDIKLSGYRNLFFRISFSYWAFLSTSERKEILLKLAWKLEKTIEVEHEMLKEEKSRNETNLSLSRSLINKYENIVSIDIN